MAAYTGIVEDAGVFDTFQGRAGAIISGGTWGAVTSGAWSNLLSVSGTVANYSPNFVTVTTQVASGASIPVGIALQDTASGTSLYSTFLRKGTIILASTGAVVAGNKVGASNAAAGPATVGPTAAYADVIGYAYTTAGSGYYALVRLDL